jgi:chromatin remodeling complex protein RSC6
MAKKTTTETKTEKTETVKTAKVDVKVEVKPDPKVEKTEEVKVEKTDEENTDDLSAAYTGCITKLSAMRQGMSSLLIELRTLQKRSERELKAVQKAGNKRKQRNATRAPSGFVKPTLISTQLADFLTRPHGTMIARTEVTREINAYIRANKLQDPTNGRKINPDAKLKKLLTLKPEDELTYFNLQRYMSQHFQKSTPAVAVVPAV